MARRRQEPARPPEHRPAAPPARLRMFHYRPDLGEDRQEAYRRWRAARAAWAVEHGFTVAQLDAKYDG